MVTNIVPPLLATWRHGLWLYTPCKTKEKKNLL